MLPPPGPIPQPKRPRFFARQFQQESTAVQRVFDVQLGVILPIVCLVLDPMVFRRGLLAGIGGPPRLAEFSVLAYGVVLVELLALLAWLIAPPGRGAGLALLSGVLGVGASFSFAVGLLLLPLSLLGLLFVVGLLGFTPFLTSFVYLRTAIRAWRQASATRSSKVVMLGAALLGVLLTLGPATLAQRRAWEVSQGARLTSLVARASAGDVIDLTTLPDQAWDRAFVFGPYSGPSQIDQAIGFEWTTMPDRRLGVGEMQYWFVFVGQGRVTSHIEWNRGLAEVCSDVQGLPRDKARLEVSYRGGERWLCPGQ